MNSDAYEAIKQIIGEVLTDIVFIEAVPNRPGLYFVVTSYDESPQEHIYRTWSAVVKERVVVDAVSAPVRYFSK